MDIRTGEIQFLSEGVHPPLSDKPYIRPMVIKPTITQLRNGKVGRNDPCPCDSGKKFKQCCWAYKI